jgi:hypothetical protein
MWTLFRVAQGKPAPHSGKILNIRVTLNNQPAECYPKVTGLIKTFDFVQELHISKKYQSRFAWQIGTDISINS